MEEEGRQVSFIKIAYLKFSDQTAISNQNINSTFISLTGDEVAAGDVILEVETDKAQIDVEAADDGIFAKILVCWM